MTHLLHDVRRTGGSKAMLRGTTHPETYNSSCSLEQDDGCCRKYISSLHLLGSETHVTVNGLLRCLKVK